MGRYEISCKPNLETKPYVWYNFTRGLTVRLSFYEWWLHIIPSRTDKPLNN
ncbi:hypothetical protein SBF1_190004 [Candidatus Desulfosporosinus infrequens]|uniref:Uncharacterized protein n=1 Tax=Candidatus Desulfosporosinus infrequens TaxID=2043169 RepID=A0A2U3KEW1_9FIRM|nr:hypothetical protein SBF1_190004 [Candidatus Desulfosporosinus infrequens]